MINRAFAPSPREALRSAQRHFFRSPDAAIEGRYQPGAEARNRAPRSRGGARSGELSRTAHRPPPRDRDQACAARSAPPAYPTAPGQTQPRSPEAPGVPPQPARSSQPMQRRSRKTAPQDRAKRGYHRGTRASRFAQEHSAPLLLPAPLIRDLGRAKTCWNPNQSKPCASCLSPDATQATYLQIFAAPLLAGV